MSKKKKAQSGFEVIMIAGTVLLLAAIVVVLASFFLISPEESVTISSDKYRASLVGIELLEYQVTLNPSDPNSGPQKIKTSSGEVIGLELSGVIPEGTTQLTFITGSDGSIYPIYTGAEGAGAPGVIVVTNLPPEVGLPDLVFNGADLSVSVADPTYSLFAVVQNTGGEITQSFKVTFLYTEPPIVGGSIVPLTGFVTKKPITGLAAIGGPDCPKVVDLVCTIDGITRNNECEAGGPGNVAYKGQCNLDYTYIGSVIINSMPATSTQQVSVGWVNPLSGSWKILVKTDALNDVFEAIESNNEDLSQITIDVL